MINESAPESRYETLANDWATRFFRFAVRHPLWVIAAFALVGGMAVTQLGDLRMDPDVEAYVPKRHPVRAFWIEAEDKFQLRDEVLLAIVDDGPNGVFTPTNLAAIAELTDRIEVLPYVVETDLHSLSRAEAIVGKGDTLDTVRFYEQPPDTQLEADRIRERVFHNPVYIDRLVSRDSSISAVVFKIDRDATDLGEAYRQMSAIGADVAPPGTRILIAGKPMVEALYGRQMASDLGRLTPLTVFAVIVLLYLCFPTLSMRSFLLRSCVIGMVLVGTRTMLSSNITLADALVTCALTLLTAPGVLAPFAVVAQSLLWTWGLQAALGEPIYIASIIMPPILLAIGCADGIHIVERYREHLRTTEAHHDAIVGAMSEIWRPVVLTSLTTAAGFAALATGDMTAYVSLGIFTAVGILAAMVLSTTLIPALLAVWPPDKLRSTNSAGPPVELLLTGLARTVSARARAVVTAGVVVCVLCLLGASQLVVDSSWVDSLAPGTSVREADKELRERHGGTTPLNIIVDSGKEGGIKDPAVLRAMDRVLHDVAEHPAVGDTRSLAEYIKRMHQALNGELPQAYRIPDDRDLVAQMLLLYSMSGDPNEFSDTVDYNYREANMTIYLRSDRMKTMRDVITRTDLALDKHLRPLGITATVTGSAKMHDTVNHLVFQGQVYSLATASVFVMAFLYLIYRSIRQVIIAIAPPAFASLATFGIMGALGIELGPSEAVIAAVALGIGIDYSIHLISRVRLEVSKGATDVAAVAEAVRTTGRGIVFNAVVVCVGFLILGFSESPRNVAFGLLIAGNMVLCCIGALTFAPALCELWGMTAAEDHESAESVFETR